MTVWDAQEVQGRDETGMPEPTKPDDASDESRDPAAQDGPPDGDADDDVRPEDRWEPQPAAWEPIGLPFPKDYVFKGLWAASGDALFVVGVGPMAYRYDGAHFEDLGPPSPPEVLNAAWGAGPLDLHAVGMRGHALRWKGSLGGGWSGGEIPGAPTLFGVAGAGDDDVFAVGAGGVILRWDGQAWNRSSVSGRRVLRGLCHDPATGLWVVGSAGTVLHREDGAFREWASPVAADLNACAPGVLAVGAKGHALTMGSAGVQSLGSVAYPDLTSVSSLPDGHAWAVGLDGQVVEFGPDGQVWLTSVANGKDLHAVHATSALSVWAVGEAGVAVRYNGTIWLPKQTGLTATLYGFHATGAGQGMAVGAGGAAAVLQAGAFTPVATGTQADLRAVLLSAPDEGTVVGAGGVILRLGGGEFAPVQSPTSRDLFAIASDGDGRLWVAGDGVVLTREDDGAWRVAFSTTEEDLRAVYALDRSHVIAVGKAGAIYGYDGQNWARWNVADIPVEGGKTVPFTASLHGVFASTPDDVWAVGESGSVLRSDGGPFQVFRLDTDVTLRSIHGSRKNSVFIAGGSGTIFRFDGVSFWRETTNTVATLYGVFQAPDGSAFAAGDTGAVLKRRP